MAYKVGDRVFIKSLEWYNKNKTMEGNVSVPLTFNKKMSRYCGMSATITRKIPHRGRLPNVPNENNYYYNIDIDNDSWNWTEEMFEDIKKIRKKKLIKLVDTNEI